MTNEVKPKPEQRDAAWYEQRGMSRYTMVLSVAHKKKLELLAAKYNMSQNAVLEVFLDSDAPDRYAEQLRAAAVLASARMGRPGKPENKEKIAVNKLLKDMTPEQLTAAKEMLFGLKATA